MKIHNIIPAIALSSLLVLGACSSEDEPDKSVSVITTGNTEQNDFDKWLKANFVEPYNIDFKYRYEDIEGDYDYYLVPARVEDAITMAHLVKYLCIETYNEVAGKDFTCSYFPKMFFNVGEWEYNNNHSQSVTSESYVAGMWNQEPYNTGYLTRGFISDYAQDSFGEDFAEVMSIYITNSAEDWEKKLELADADGADGKALITLKLDIVREYMAENFNVDIDKLRDELQRRQEQVVAGNVDLSDITVK